MLLAHSHNYLCFQGTVGLGNSPTDLTRLVLRKEDDNVHVLDAVVSVLFGVYANEALTHVQKEEMDSLVLSTEGQAPQELSDLFREVSILYLHRGRN